jgi:hypothetical protein
LKIEKTNGGIATRPRTRLTNQPTNQSTNQPTSQPASQPASQPTNQPTNQPTLASEALKVNTSLTFINLEANKIGAEGAKALAEVHSRCSCECSLKG